MPTDPNESSIEIETRYLRIVSAVKATVQIPVAVKLSPYFTSFANVARKFVQQGGADALVLFNRFYQPDVDPERLEVVPDVVLSTPTAHEEDSNQGNERPKGCGEQSRVKPEKWMVSSNRC